MKTIKVRVAVAVDGDGKWCVFGAHGWTEADMIVNARDGLDAFNGDPPEALHWLTAELPIPEPSEVAAKVEEA